MFWTVIGHIADFLGIISCVISFASFAVVSSLKRQKENYGKENLRLYESLCAIHLSIWTDGLNSESVLSELRILLYYYRKRYWLLTSIPCHIHVYCCLRLLSKDDFMNYDFKIRNHIDYLIANLIPEV